MTLNCRGKLIDVNTPKIMGILNLTPDSFYDGGKYKSDKEALRQVEKMLADGATFIDIGGQSSRPNAQFLGPEEEAKRVVSLVKRILETFPETIISIDTFHSFVAQKAVEAGAAIINDISAGNLDDKMMKTVALLGVPYIMMHMRGTPQTMQTHTHYENMMQEIIYYFSEKVVEARRLGITDIVIDPGFGFAKTPTQNFELLRKLNLLKSLKLPILMGVSRKSTIYKTLHIKPAQALNGTTVLNTLSLLNGAQILRVHDVGEAQECVQLMSCYIA